MTTKAQEAFENSRTKRMDFTHNGYSYRSSETQTEFEKFEDGYDIGRKQALEEAMEICKSVAVCGVNGRLASKTCATKIQELIK